MLVKDWMSKNVITIGVHDSMQKAISLMTDYQIGMLPVTEGGKLVGIVTDRDLKRASPSDAAVMETSEILNHLSRVKVGSIMSRNPITVIYNYTVEETAEVLLNNKISGCPVTDEEGRIMGVITKGDLFNAIISLTGLSKRGVLFGFRLEDRPGSIREVADIIRRHGGRLVSILSSYDKAPKGYRFAYVRAFNLDRERLPRILEELKRVTKVLYMVDHRQNVREIYHDTQS